MMNATVILDTYECKVNEMKYVVHCKKEKYDVYIGRGSKWGNPFVMRSEADRERVIEQFRKYLWEQIKTGAITKDELRVLDGKRLGCFCAPKACHGDVIVAAIKWSKQ